jgi:uncharacterized DUF497 family protein
VRLGRATAAGRFIVPPENIDRVNFWGYIISVFSWDEPKRIANLAKHGVDFVAVEDFDFETAVTTPDDRRDYGEVREIAIGFIGERLHVLVCSRRLGAVRVISLRRANRKEAAAYEQKTP